MFYSQFTSDMATLLGSQPSVARDLMKSIVEHSNDLPCKDIIERFDSLTSYFFSDDERSYYIHYTQKDFEVLLRTLARKGKNDAALHVFKTSLSFSRAAYTPYIDKTSSTVNPVCSALIWLIQEQNDVLFDRFCKDYLESVTVNDLEIAYARAVTDSRDFDCQYSKTELNNEQAQLTLWLLSALKRNRQLSTLGNMPKLCAIIENSFYAIAGIYRRHPELFERGTANPLTEGKGCEQLTSLHNKILNKKESMAVLVTFMTDMLRDIAYSRYAKHGYSGHRRSVTARMQLFNQVRKSRGWLSDIVNSQRFWDIVISQFIDYHYNKGARQSFGSDAASALRVLIKFRNARFFDAKTGASSLLFFGNKPTGLGNLLHATETEKYSILANYYVDNYPVEFWLKEIKTANQTKKLREIYDISTVQLLSLMDDTISDTAKRAVMHDLNQTI